MLLFEAMTKLDSSTQVMGGIMALVYLMALKNIKNEKCDNYSSIGMSLGIFGTFLGIFLGLYEFDAGDIEGSTPKLLEGLKLAFATSILGLFGNIAVKGVKTVIIKVDRGEDTDEDDLEAVSSEEGNAENSSKNNELARANRKYSANPIYFFLIN